MILSNKNQGIRKNLSRKKKVILKTVKLRRKRLVNRR